MGKYAISIKWSDEDNSFVATIPGVKALSAFGTTREEALSELHVAAEAFFEALKSAGKSLPLPKKVTPYSGQLRLRMPKSLHAALAEEAEDEKISLNTYIVALLSERHIEKRMLNLIKAEKIVTFSSRLQTAHKIEENKKKYRSDKHKK